MIDTKKVEEIYNTEKTSSVLRENTLDAINNDVFGVPTFIYQNQMYWGQDRILFLEKEIRKINA